ncbi:aldo/keto reductase [Cryptosporangium phraense]|uniref:Aldo/keto reductase n=1 Tax=Cryptosporangium phraense TaxID=2593070 RepID=A0A545AYT1_9ACTN|nr:aldo/keto reductase [Cryptosporangium phraense]TQS46500.1 aldo/keto reductase [Cryptosporangium phraense]
MRYHLLGRTGLRVSALGLGTMTFGSAAWHADPGQARQIFRRYLDLGGNFVDTANIYGGGASEELVGRFVEETGARDRLVLATKFGGPVDATDPNGRGNGRKHILSALEASLRRLRTDYVDLYWLHLWDRMTPPEEVMSTFDALVRDGRVRAVGLSDVPAWWTTKAQLVADHRGWEPVAALQLEYSLLQRTIEWELVPAARDLGMSVVAWSPLANGLLTGKYSPDGGEGRLTRGWPGREPAPTERDWAVVEALREAAEAIGCHPAQLALKWVTGRDGVAGTLIGATTVEQLEANVGALDVEVPSSVGRTLDEVSYQVPTVFPHNVYARFS